MRATTARFRYRNVTAGTSDGATADIAPMGGCFA
jgi:hypothetical protein